MKKSFFLIIFILLGTFGRQEGTRRLSSADAPCNCTADEIEIGHVICGADDEDEECSFPVVCPHPKEIPCCSDSAECAQVTCYHKLNGIERLYYGTEIQTFYDWIMNHMTSYFDKDDLSTYLFMDYQDILSSITKRIWVILFVFGGFLIISGALAVGCGFSIPSFLTRGKAAFMVIVIILILCNFIWGYFVSQVVRDYLDYTQDVYLFGSLIYNTAVDKLGEYGFKQIEYDPFAVKSLLEISEDGGSFALKDVLNIHFIFALPGFLMLAILATHCADRYTCASNFIGTSMRIVLQTCLFALCLVFFCISITASPNCAGEMTFLKAMPGWNHETIEYYYNYCPTDIDDGFLSFYFDETNNYRSNANINLVTNLTASGGVNIDSSDVAEFLYTEMEMGCEKLVKLDTTMIAQSLRNVESTMCEVLAPMFTIFTFLIWLGIITLDSLSFIDCCFKYCCTRDFSEGFREKRIYLGDSDSVDRHSKKRRRRSSR